MISNPTTLVLGAGASCPFGFPSGQALREKICEPRTVSSFLVKKLKECGVVEREFREFQEQFTRSAMSIDAFLAHRAAFSNVGRLTIAILLLYKEHPQTLYRRPSQNVSDSVIGFSDWYQDLWSAMRAGVKNPDDLLKNKLKIITFNYERSLEKFLLECVSSTFDMTEIQANEIVSELRIHHVYGKLGELVGTEAIPYAGLPESANSLKQAASRIQLMPTERQDSDSVCEEYLNSADRVLFLGFGFDEMNCQRLGIKKVLRARRSNSCIVMGTAAGLTADQRTIAADLVHPTPGDVYLANYSCLEFLRERASLLR